ncbi:MAG: hypothetical protein LQ341_006529 [Variospora aurantia]|nr:MAG: hypothetical protein LQ341_006529 [Variospora aurantia]
MPPANQRRQRHERNQSTDSDASQEEDRYDSNLSPTSRCQEEMARNTRGSQTQISKQHIVYYAPPTQRPEPVPVASSADTPAPAIAPPPAILPADTPAIAIAEPLSTVPTAPPAPALATSLTPTAVNTPAPTPAAPLPFMATADTTTITPAITPATIPAATSAPTAIPIAAPTPAAVSAPPNASVEHPAQTSPGSGSTNQTRGSLVRVPSRVKKMFLLKRLLLVLAGLGSLWVIGVPTYNIHYSPQSQAGAGFRTPSGDFVVQETGHGAILLSDMRHLVLNSSHHMRPQLLEHIHNARVDNFRADDSAQTFHRQTLDWSSYISGLQQELTSIERTSGNPMLKATDIIRFLLIPGIPKPHNLLSLPETPDTAIRQRVLKEQKDLQNSFEKMNSSALRYGGDVASWKTSVKGIDAAIGPAKQGYVGQKIKIAERAFKISTKHQEEARRTDDHLMQMQETDNLTCRAMKHVKRVQQGSEFAVSKLQDIQRVLTELMLECSTGGTCSTFPDELKLLGADEEDVAKYWEEQKEKGDEKCREDEEDREFEEGYVQCVVM